MSFPLSGPIHGPGRLYLLEPLRAAWYGEGLNTDNQAAERIHIEIAERERPAAMASIEQTTRREVVCASQLDPTKLHNLAMETRSFEKVWDSPLLFYHNPPKACTPSTP